jgi:hypothetical protein
MDRSPLAQFALIAVAGLLAATLISWEGGRGGSPRYADTPFSTGSVTIRGRFTGVDADGERLVWQVAAPDAPSLRLQVEPVGGPDAAGKERWVVIARLEAETAAPAAAASAELTGAVDWLAGTLHLEGEVRSGPLQGEQLRIDARLIGYDLDGVMAIARARRVAARAAPR